MTDEESFYIIPSLIRYDKADRTERPDVMDILHEQKSKTYAQLFEIR